MIFLTKTMEQYSAMPVADKVIKIKFNIKHPIMISANIFSFAFKLIFNVNKRGIADIKKVNKYVRYIIFSIVTFPLFLLQNPSGLLQEICI